MHFKLQVFSHNERQGHYLLTVNHMWWIDVIHANACMFEFILSLLLFRWPSESWKYARTYIHIEFTTQTDLFHVFKYYWLWFTAIRRLKRSVSGISGKGSVLKTKVLCLKNTLSCSQFPYIGSGVEWIYWQKPTFGLQWTATKVGAEPPRTDESRVWIHLYSLFRCK